MSGNMRSVSFFEEVMQYYHRNFRRSDYYDLFLAIGDLEISGSGKGVRGKGWVSEPISEQLLLNASQGGNATNPRAKSIDIVSMPYALLETLNGRKQGKWAAGFCPVKIDPPVSNHLGLLHMAHKFVVAFAAMRREELRTHQDYDYVVRSSTVC